MHHDLDIFKDPVFWGALFLGILPIVLGGAVLVLSNSWWRRRDRTRPGCFISAFDARRAASSYALYRSLRRIQMCFASSALVPMRHVRHLQNLSLRRLEPWTRSPISRRRKSKERPRPCRMEPCSRTHQRRQSPNCMKRLGQKTGPTKATHQF